GGCPPRPRAPLRGGGGGARPDTAERGRRDRGAAGPQRGRKTHYALDARRAAPAVVRRRGHLRGEPVPRRVDRAPARGPRAPGGQPLSRADGGREPPLLWPALRPRRSAPGAARGRAARPRRPAAAPP